MRPFVALGAPVNRCDMLREVPRHLLQRDCGAPLAPDGPEPAWMQLGVGLALRQVLHHSH
eukprot:4293517-Prorocentrum_lima.AAC.1